MKTADMLAVEPVSVALVFREIRTAGLRGFSGFSITRRAMTLKTR
ncbi:hypothetical protein RHI9324_05435 [Rhizobium sp. CECT 9324]|nr:hypothetical protein RHI9324_05435 [Rhizobium sp. CECT 9324]